ncbi:MAG TPA: FAD:protein FMN transferase [Gemmatimonadaceae bacterium]|nr:FAD:protein FMN transferase [Gemmatimonadaceae bacterium]
MSDGFFSLVHTFARMGTVITIEVVGRGDDDARRADRASAVGRAADWFASIEQCCSRFDPQSELRQLTAHANESKPVRVSTMLFAAIQFALTVAEETGGAFDPTVGRRMESRGFDRNYQTGESAASDIDADPSVSWRDVLIDADEQTVTLLKPLVLDLGAVAKGLAVDVAARELDPFENFAIDAGGDLYLGGHNVKGEPWAIGIRHPREQSLIETLHLSNTAVCTSGDYEKESATDGGHHIMDARTGESASELASVTVIAPSAMVADALATAAFALGVSGGKAFLERHGVQGLMLTPSLERFETARAS